ncbi:MAG: hypothetical protein JW947_05265 [Sedimentisphaerales bacterium]|nr:hypothetical protein [Sedimentisphaerales bacterium]
MGKYKYLNQKQAAVLDDLFNSELDEQGVLEKHKVRRSTYERWLDNELFSERFDQYIQRIRRRSEILIAKYRNLAAAKLIELTTSDKPETARRACLAIISQPRIKPEAERSEKESSKQAETLTDAQAGRILAAMAEEKKIRSTKS